MKKTEKIVVKGTVWSYFEEGYIQEVVRDFASCKSDLDRLLNTCLGKTLEKLEGKKVRITFEEIGESS